VAILVLALGLPNADPAYPNAVARTQVRPKYSMPLMSGWEFRKAGQNTWYPAEVPGCIHTDLIRNKLIEDPFFRNNEEKLQWIGKTFWSYRKTFSVEPDVLNYNNIELVFEGLDTYASVFLNETLILRADNMFRQWRVACKKALKVGENRLRVDFSSPINKVLPRVKSLTVQLPAPMDVGEKTSPYTRKAAYQYGWNWAPRLVTSGIWRPVTLEAWDQAKFTNLHILQKSVTSSRAHLDAEVELVATVEAEAKLLVDSPSSKFEAQEQSIKLRSGQNTVTVSIDVFNPSLWWPNGLGQQPLYDLRARLFVHSKLIDQMSTRIGLRSLELQQKPDRWGKSFQFVINGVAVFAKGGNWIPSDTFPTRATAERYRHLIQSCRDANMNMLRVWGGGIYENDTFYDLCDEMGILIWQDFMFANALYPADETFLDNVRQEAIDVLKRLRNHSSVALWCGNNEIETGWFHWGWKKRLPARLWDDYKKIFHELLPGLCHLHDPSRAYWPSSPSSDLEEDPDSQRSGDAHYWDVWNQGLPSEAHRKQFPRFMSEYGFQSFPEIGTIDAFTRMEDRDLNSPPMTAHQKYTEGNQLIRKYILQNYPEPKDFDSYLYVSQILQAEVVKEAAEHFRRIMPRSMGSLYWQVDDCWPAISWSSIDYLGRWKALQFYARRFYQDLLVSPALESNTINVDVISDRPEVIQATLKVSLMDFDGNTILENRIPVEAAPLQSCIYMRLPKAELLSGKDSRRVFLNCELFVGGQQVTSNRFFFEPFKRLSLPVPQFRTRIESSRNGFKVTLVSDKFAKDVCLSLDQSEGRFSDNFFDLLPNQAAEIEYLADEPIDSSGLSRKLRVRSLVEAFKK
jgi:beta-mannosidase